MHQQERANEQALAGFPAWNLPTPLPKIALIPSAKRPERPDQSYGFIALQTVLQPSGIEEAFSPATARKAAHSVRIQKPQNSRRESAGPSPVA